MGQSRKHRQSRSSSGNSSPSSAERSSTRLDAFLEAKKARQSEPICPYCGEDEYVDGHCSACGYYFEPHD